MIPGLILLSVNGISNVIVGILGIRQSNFFPILTIICGFLLIGWLTIQILLIKEFFAPAHVTYYVVGVVMVFLGFRLKKQKKDYEC